jgi:hypothetical protein
MLIALHEECKSNYEKLISAKKEMKNANEFVGVNLTDLINYFG